MDHCNTLHSNKKKHMVQLLWWHEQGRKIGADQQWNEGFFIQAKPASASVKNSAPLETHKTEKFLKPEEIVDLKVRFVVQKQMQHTCSAN